MRLFFSRKAVTERIWKWGHWSCAKVGGGHRSGAKCRKRILVVAHFGYRSTISRFGERFRDGQYSLVSFLFAVLLFMVPRAQPFVKVGGTCPRASWTRRHWFPLESLTSHHFLSHTVQAAVLCGLKVEPHKWESAVTVSTNGVNFLPRFAPDLWRLLADRRSTAVFNLDLWLSHDPDLFSSHQASR